MFRGKLRRDSQPRPWYVRVTNPLNVWGLFSPTTGLSIALAGPLRRDVQVAVERLVGSPGAGTVTLPGGQEVQVYKRKPAGIRLTPWPKGVPIPEDFE